MLENMIKLINYYSPSENKNKYLKEKLNKLKSIKSEQKLCNFLGCKEVAIDSHEISKGIFLSQISDENNEVNILARDFKGNIRRFYFKKENVKSATTFPGFCAAHDKKIFTSFENGTFTINQDFVQKQSLRTLKKEISLIHDEIKTLSTLIFSPEKHEDIRLLKKNYHGQAKNLKRYQKLFNNLSHSIDKGGSIMQFKIIDDVPNNMVQFSKLRHDIETILGIPLKHAYIFIFLLFNDGKQKLILATFKDKTSNKLMEFLVQNKYFLNEYILINKERFIVSQNFINSLDHVDYNTMLDDNKIIQNKFFLKFMGF